MPGPISRAVWLKKTITPMLRNCPGNRYAHSRTKSGRTADQSEGNSGLGDIVDPVRATESPDTARKTFAASKRNRRRTGLKFLIFCRLGRPIVGSCGSCPRSPRHAKTLPDLIPTPERSTPRTEELLH